MTTIVPDSSMDRRAIEQQQLIVGKRRRKIREAATGYLFVLPATIATFVFGLWPVVGGFYESLKSGSPITNKYVGLGNYVRSLGSLTYMLIFALSLIFIYLGFRYWRTAFARAREHGRDLWFYIVPGLLAGLGLIAVAFIVVTGLEGYSWFPATMFVLAIGGFFTAEHLQLPRDEWDSGEVGLTWLLVFGFGLIWALGPRIMSEVGAGTIGWIVLAIVLVGFFRLLLPRMLRIKAGLYVTNMVLMGTMILLGILLARFGVAQMESDVEEAQEIAALVFNQSVLDGTVDVAIEDARIAGLVLEQIEAGEFLVQVKIGDQTIEAPLAPGFYDEIAVDRISRLETQFANNQRVYVLLPDGTVAEGQLTGLPMGQQLDVGLVAEDPTSVQELDIYSALDVGEAVVQNGGHTEPLRKQIYGALVVFLGIGTIATMSWVRGRVDDEIHPGAYRWLHYGRLALGCAVAIAFFYLIGSVQLSRQAAAGMDALTEAQFDHAYEFATGEAPRPILRTELLRAQLLYWPQVLSVAVGTFLIGMAYLVWQSAQKRETPLGVGMTVVLAIAMMVGGWLMLSELPRTLSLGGREAEEAYDSLVRTAMYSAGTVPVQLTLGLFLAYLLFSEITWGKSLLRVIYFMPYIAPSVATSTVFLVIFRLDKNSLANRFLSVFGIEPLTWLKEPNGIVRIFYEQVLGGNPLHIPEGLAGPSLALTTVILYNIWVFAGYNAVVFLAGLGAIPTELYEAAEVDGAGRWARFRNITLPLLSPTTFFLSMLSIIGTFKAFSHIYVLRNQATGKEIDTMSVHIFNTLYSANDPGYAAALAFSLFGVILILTVVQGRLARGQVFYG